jgi:phospholipid transport system substrate-binding protein
MTSTTPTRCLRNSWLPRRALLRLLSMATLGLLLWQPLALAAPSEDGARALVEAAGARVLDILRDEALDDDEKFDRLVEVLTQSIDVELVGRLILGRHWRAADEAQRAEYQELFRSYALANLASRLHLYQGQTFEVTGAQTADDRDALVSSRINSRDRPPLRVVWRIRELDGGDLVAIDMVVEGVSLIVTQRSEFASVIERSGIDGLLAELRQRINRA